jgi:hypothetical protein
MTDSIRLEAKLRADAQVTAAPRLLSDCPACGGQISIPLRNDIFDCDECGAPLVREVRIATKDETSEPADGSVFECTAHLIGIKEI